jgi:ATP-binding cassette subfamily F protein uup
MAILTIRNLDLSFGEPPLLVNASAQVEAGEKVVLLGRNGCGKSTLLACLAGQTAPNRGELYVQPGAKRGFLPQTVPQGLTGTCHQVVSEGLAQQRDLVERYHRAAQMVAAAPSEAALRKLEAIHQELGAEDAWALHERVLRICGELGLDPEQPFETLSGGGQRRALLARALVGQPDILLLDEPTNHLDIDSIQWLEKLLQRFEGTLFLVTHDRMLTRNVAGRILEMDRGGLTSWACDYDSYCRRREEMLTAEAQRWDNFDKKMAKEEIWASGGIKARRTRNEGRVRALEAMREEWASRRKVQKKARLQVQEAERSGEVIIEVEDLGFAYPSRTIVKGFSTRIMRGDHIGLLGRNGSGKTTMLRLLLGTLTPQTGEVRHGVNLEVAYFDQLKANLNLNESVKESISQGQDLFEFDGRPTHVYAYLDRFLFERARCDVPVGVLSGGERSRLVLARLFRTPCNVLVLDEPTNDLDVETLELLEQLLIEFKGTLLVVSHDREFLNNVVTSTMVMEGDGQVGEYAGGYYDWVAQRPVVVASPKAEAGPKKERQRPPDQPRKLTFKEAAELEGLVGRIGALEDERAELLAQLADPAFYKSNPAQVVEANRRLPELDGELEGAVTRWAELEEIRESFARRKQ